jgi:hypothetical protein
MLKWIFGKWDGGEWTDRSFSGHGQWWALVNTVMNIRVPKNVGNYLTFCEPVSFSRRTMLHVVSNKRYR